MNNQVLEEKGVVVDITEGLVWVQTEIKTTCGTCKAKDNCSTSSIAKAFSPKPNVISIESDMAVKVGDTVIIGIEEAFVLRSSFYVYLLPLFCFILMAAFTEVVFASDDKIFELLSVFLAFSAGGLGFAWAKKRLSRLGCKENGNVRLLKIDPHSIPIKLN